MTDKVYIQFKIMNKCIFQFWEQSNVNGDIYPSGCSLHINFKSYIEYIKNITRDNTVPILYDRIFMDPIECFVDDILFDKLKEQKNIRLKENEKNNLISLEELIFKS